MSAWRLAFRTLARLGGTATSAQVELECGGSIVAINALSLARRMGLVESSTTPGQGRVNSWSITPFGEEYLLGTVEQRESRGSGTGRYWAATWLRSLPRGLRICKSENDRSYFENRESI